MNPEEVRAKEEQLLNEKYGKGYHIGKKMQSGEPMPEEPFDMCEYLVSQHPDFYYIDENGQTKRRV